MCRNHATVRSLLKELIAATEQITVTDMEAGLEHFSRGTTRHADTALVVIEPYYKSLETGARIYALAQELGINNVAAVANKVRDAGEESAVRELCERRGMKLAALVPYDETVLVADRSGTALLDVDNRSASVMAIKSLAEQLMKS